MHIHIATVGGSIQPVITGFKAIPAIDVVYLIVSAQRKHSGEDLEKKFRNMEMDCRMKIVSGFDFQEVVDTIYAIYGENADRKDVRYTINITGGSNIMAAAACSTAFFIKGELYYVMYDREKDVQDSVENRVVRIPTPKIPNVNGLSPKTREILEYILDNSAAELPNQKVADAFGMKRQLLAHYTKILKAEGIITTERMESNNRLTKIVLTQEGRMVAGWIKTINRSDKKIPKSRAKRG